MIQSSYRDVPVNSLGNRSAEECEVMSTTNPCLVCYESHNKQT